MTHAATEKTGRKKQFNTAYFKRAYNLGDYVTERNHDDVT